jgi:hypothetical protein
MVMSSPYLNEHSYNPAFVCGLSALAEPAYVDCCFNKEFDMIERFCENRLSPCEPEKIVFDPMHSVSAVDHQSSDFCDSGKILKEVAAAATMHLSNLASTYACDGYTQSAGAEQSQQKECRKRRTKRRALILIATRLNELQVEDPDKIVVVRKINRLGFDSADILREHFEQFGSVDKVRLSNAHDKERGSYPFHVRLRPSGFGFVVFENSEAAAQVLAEGESRVINGVEVHVRAFERRRFDSASCVSEEMVEECVEETSSIATASTRCSIFSGVELEEE